MIVSSKRTETPKSPMIAETIRMVASELMIWALGADFRDVGRPYFAGIMNRRSGDVYAVFNFDTPGRSWFVPLEGLNEMISTLSNAIILTPANRHLQGQLRNARYAINMGAARKSIDEIYIAWAARSQPTP